MAALLEVKDMKVDGTQSLLLGDSSVQGRHVMHCNGAGEHSGTKGVQEVRGASEKGSLSHHLDTSSFSSHLTRGP